MSVEAERSGKAGDDAKMLNTKKLAIGWRGAVCAAMVLCVAGVSRGQTKASGRDTARGPDPTGAMLRSWILPGWGQWYNGRKTKAAVVFVAEVGLAGYALWQDHLASQSATAEERLAREDRRNAALWWLAGVVLLSGLEAYVDAHLAGFDVAPNLSVEARAGPAVGLSVRF
ncbi:MAG: DUF5683 domain-containing protein [candidate division KSB1 bacterium]|nr:DUF5683 domain-containing protein [candidate division KSB1 bacterium]